MVLQAVVEARRQYPDITIEALAQHLFDAGVYQGKGRDGTAKPASRSMVYKWCLEAKEAGLLS